MQNRFALAIASAAALLLILVGAGLAMLLDNGPAVRAVTASTGSSGTVQVDTAQGEVAIEQQVQSLLDTREAAYRQALADADSKLQQANAQLEQAYAIIGTLKQAATTAVTSTAASPPPQQAQQDQAAQPGQSTQAAQAPAYAVSADQAATIALIVEPSGQLIKTPELVSFQGTPAYEVQLDIGTIYVDANSRSVLYDGTAPVQVRGSNSSNRGEQEHEGGEGND